MLSSHPQVVNIGEVFHPNSPEFASITDPVACIESRFLKQSQRKHATHFGYKIFAHHAQKPPLNAIWDYMQQKRFKIILLTRQNLLNRYLSERLVIAHKSSESPSNAWGKVQFFKPVAIDPAICLKNIEKHVELEKQLAASFANNPVLRLTYEDLCDRNVCYPKVLEFLELPYSEPTTKLIKQRTRSQQMMIENYWELKKAFKETEYIKFFDEEEDSLFL